MALLGVMAALGLGAYAGFAAGGGSDFSITRTPASQTVSRGQTATYTVTVKRLNGFAKPVALKVSQLPGGSSASWERSDGTTSNVLPPSFDRARLTIKTASGTTTGTSHPLITATSGNLSHTTTATMVVQSSSQPNFILAASPWNRSVLQGDQTSYQVNVTRTAGFSGPVNLSVAGLPNGATASWNPSHTVPGPELQYGAPDRDRSQRPTGSYDLTITGSATVGGSTVTRYTAATLIVEKTKAFRIAGNLGSPLAPGRKVPLDLALTNPYGFNLRITNLAVALAGTDRPRLRRRPELRGHADPCRPVSDHAAGGADEDARVSSGSPTATSPRSRCSIRPWNQDACKNAAISLHYSGSARK